MKWSKVKNYFFHEHSDTDSIHDRIATLMIAFSLTVTIIVSSFYVLTGNWHMLPGGLAGVALCGLSLALIQHSSKLGKLFFVLAANFLVVLSHQQFNGLIPTYLYFFATGTGPLVLFHPRDLKYIIPCATVSLLAGLITITFPRLFGMPAPVLPAIAEQFIVPIVWVTSFSIATAPPALLFLFSRKLHERMVTEQAKRFHSARLQSLGEIAAGVAHEINNPLAVVAGKAEALLEALDAGPPLKLPKFRSDLMLIDQNCEHIAKIVRTLQTYSRQGPKDKARLVAVKTLIEDTALLMKQLLEKNATKLHMDCPESIQISAVSSEMMQALSNLISNAVDAMTSIAEDRRVLSIQVTTRERKVLIAVADQGIGFEVEYASKIFDPFFTTKDPGKGTGLGLSIVQSIMTRHQGQIRAERKSGQTIFTMELPLPSEAIPS